MILNSLTIRRVRSKFPKWSKVNPKAKIQNKSFGIYNKYVIDGVFYYRHGAKKA